MPELKDNFFENILFRFENTPCKFVTDITHEAPGESPRITYKLEADPSNKVHFGYAAKKGLVRIAPNGTIEETNILGQLIALPKKKEKDLQKFLSDNGFLFPIQPGHYEIFDASQINTLIERIRCTVELMSATSEIRKDYKKIFQYTMALLFADNIHIQTNKMLESEDKYQTCVHPFTMLLQMAPQTSDLRSQEAFDKSTYSIEDSLYGTYDFDINEYNDIIGGYSSEPGHKDAIFQNISRLYANFDGTDEQRKLIDLLFHFSHKIGVLNVNTGDYYAEPHYENLDDKMRTALLEIARIVIGEELNSNLKGIHPIYDSEKMAPAWKVDSLINAVYFSIFYLKPDLELYRPCDNPRCGNYFLVKTTSTKTRFCSSACCNRVTQDRYRKKKREQVEQA